MPSSSTRRSATTCRSSSWPATSPWRTSPCDTCCSRQADCPTWPAARCWHRPSTAHALEAIAELKDSELTSPPGDTWLYANANYVLAGLVVERASGMSYADYVQARIFDPLGMTHSYVSLETAAADGLAKGHRFWFGVPARPVPTHRERSCWPPAT